MAMSYDLKKRQEEEERRKRSQEAPPDWYTMKRKDQKDNASAESASKGTEKTPLIIQGQSYGSRDEEKDVNEENNEVSSITLPQT